MARLDKGGHSPQPCEQLAACYRQPASLGRTPGALRCRTPPARHHESSWPRLEPPAGHHGQLRLSARASSALAAGTSGHRKPHLYDCPPAPLTCPARRHVRVSGLTGAIHYITRH